MFDLLGLFSPAYLGESLEMQVVTLRWVISPVGNETLSVGYETCAWLDSKLNFSMDTLH